MPEYLAPGVYIEETSFRSRTIEGVPTSIAAFVDTFARGPVNEPVELFSLQDLETKLGGLAHASEASYGIRQFFLNGGTHALAVRVVGDGAAAARASVPALGGGQAFVVTAISPGTWGNHITVRIDLHADGRFDLGITEHTRDARGHARITASEQWRDLTTNPADPGYIEHVVNADGAGSSMVRISDVVPGSQPRPGGTLSGDLAQVRITMRSRTFRFGVRSAAARSWIGEAELERAPHSLRDAAHLLQRALHRSHPHTSLLAGATVEVIRHGGSAHLHVCAGAVDPTTVIAFATGTTGSPVEVLRLATPPAGLQPAEYPLRGGTDGASPGADDLIGSEAEGTGMHALDRAPAVCLLCIPRTAGTGGGEAALSSQDARRVLDAAIEYATLRRAMLLIDPPADVRSVARVRAWLDEGLRSPNSTLYFPRVNIPDPLNQGHLRSVGASGAMAGVFARTDQARGVWKAPAGLEATLVGVAGFDVDQPLTHADLGTLTAEGINPLREVPGAGAVAWGARTLDGAQGRGSEWVYVPVRRLALFVAESIQQGTRWAVFEPNEGPLWAEVRAAVDAFLHDLFRRGALTGATPRDAYFVRCDASTMTAEDRAQGLLRITVGIAATRPAEFIVLHIGQRTADTGP